MSTQTSLLDRVLIDINTHPDQTAEQRATRIGSNANGVHTACWTLRRQELLDGDNKPTQAGIARYTAIKAMHEGATAPVEAPEPEKSRRGRPAGRKAKKSAPPQSKAKAVAVPAIPAANKKPIITVDVSFDPSARAAAARDLASGLVDNAERSFQLLRATIDDQVDGMSSLLEASLDQMELSIQLLRTGYRAAA